MVIAAVMGVVAASCTAVVAYQLRCLIKEIKSLHHDISIIRLDNTRTLAEIRRRQK